MAASVNNIAATFATLPLLSSSSSSSSSSNSNQKTLPVSVSTSWNPHSALRKPLRSSFLNLYGPPGPPPLRIIPSASPRTFSPPSIFVGRRMPNVTLSYLHRDDTVRTSSLSSLCKGNKAVFIAVSAAFSPSCTHFVRRVGSMMAKSRDLIACVAVNDVFVMKAWGEHLGLGRSVKMLSDVHGEFWKALGLEVLMETKMAANMGLGLRSRSFYLCAIDGLITSITFDEDDLIKSAKSTVI